jgi:Protein of unknown function (DUF4435)
MFIRTSSGIKNTDLFYRNQYLVYVEGKDDIPFWSIFFPPKIDGYQCKIKHVGGSEIKKYITELCKEESRYAVAIDSDYRLFIGLTHDHNQVLETFVHSIENVIISPQSLLRIIRIKSRSEEYIIDSIESWLKHFNEATHGLMVADYLIQKTAIGKECLGGNCFRFLKNERKKEPFFDVEKIDLYIKSLTMPEALFSSAMEELKDYKPSQHIRGHFFFGASLCFMNYEVNKLRSNTAKQSISNDDLFAMLILACGNLVLACPELKNLSKRVMKIAQEVVKLLSSS